MPAYHSRMIERITGLLTVICLVAGGCLFFIGTSPSLAQAPSSAIGSDVSECMSRVAEASALADKGDAEGLFTLGKYHYFGVCVPQDDIKAAHFLSLAAEKGVLCAPAVLETFQEPGIGDAELARQEVFRRCAFAMTRILDRQLAERLVANLLLPGKMPADLRSEINRMYATDVPSPENMFALARHYVGKEHIAPLREAAMFWLNRLSAEETPVKTKVHYFLGRLAFGDGGDLVDETTGEMWLYMAAKSGEIPDAQREYALRLSRRDGGKHPRITAYAWLLLAQRNGVDVTRDMAEVGAGLTELDFQVAKAISRQIQPD